MNGLGGGEIIGYQVNGSATYDHIVNDPVILPYCLGVKCGLACMGVFLGPQYGAGFVKVTRWRGTAGAM